MGDKKDKNTKLGIGEINTIRDILVGSKFDEMERQLNSLQHDVSNLRLDLNNSLKEMKTSIKQNRKDLRGDLLKKIVELENRMIKGQEKSIRRIKRDKLDQTNSLAKIFDKLSKDIKSEK